MKTWHYLGRLIAFRPLLFSFFVFSLMTVTLFPLLTGLIIRQIFDGLTGNTPVAIGSWGLMALLVSATVGEIGFTLLSDVAHVFFRKTVSALLRRNLFAHILQRPGAQALSMAPGEAVSRFRDDVDYVERMMANAPDPLVQIVFLLAALTIMLRINWFITLMIIVPVLGALLLAQQAAERIERYHQARQAATGRVMGFLGEMFGAVQAVKVATAEAAVVSRFVQINQGRQAATVKDRTFNALLDSINTNMVAIGTGITLLLAAQAMQAGTFTVGDFALFVTYLQTLTSATRFMGFFIADYQQAGVSFTRLQELMVDAPAEQIVAHAPVYLRGAYPEIPTPSKVATDPLDELIVRGLTYRYPRTDRGVADVDLRLTKGSFTVITGRIGAGKTTLLRTLLGLLPAEMGEIRWNGRLITNPGDFFTPPRCAYTPQVPRLYSATMQDNILLGLSAESVDLPAALHLAVLEADLAQLEQGLETVVGPRGVKLSGGQIQRTAAARMFVREPELMVFDDLSSALDVETEKTLWQRLAAWKTDGRSAMTYLVVSHRRAALQQANQILVLEEGRVVAQGTLNALLQTSPTFCRMWEDEQRSGVNQS
ncbi:MAG: ABC transporter ATP-binding protein [Caldilineaceae bacterium]